MKEIFYPTLVISIGPSAKKALDFLDGMLVDIPNYFRELIDLYNINDLDSSCEYIQRIIDEKLLSSGGVNRLVDLGYKIRTENTESVSINIYIYWDVYGINFPVMELINNLYKLNYGGIDKSKHSGASFFIIPIFDREWKYDKEVVFRGIDRLEEIVKFLSTDDNIINKDSKIFLAHNVSKDGTRVSKDELGYVCAMISYLNILPSEQPPLVTFNKRMLKHEANYKIGTIGISTLTVFKERLKTGCRESLARDLLNRAIKYEEDLNYSIYKGSVVSKNRYFIKELQLSSYSNPNRNFKINRKSYFKGCFKKVLRLYNNDKYIMELEEWKLKENKLVEENKIIIDERMSKISSSTKNTIKKDIDDIVKNYSLLQGKRYLEFVLNEILNEEISFGDKKYARVFEENEDTIGDIERGVQQKSSVKGILIRSGILGCLIIYLLINIIFKFNFTMEYKGIIYFIIVILGFVFTVGIILLECLYRHKKINKLMDRYINKVNNFNQRVIDEYVNDKVIKYNRTIKEYIYGELENIDKCISNCTFMERYISKNEKNDLNLGNFITDLLDKEDRERFYKENNKSITLIYREFMESIEGFYVLKEKSVFNNINEFTKGISCDYINEDFYKFIKFKWGEDGEEKIESWIQKGKVKAKELLQYTEGDFIECNKLFLGSKEFINSYKEVLRRDLDKFIIIPIEGKDIYTNCISIVKLTLGIQLKDIISFENIKME